MADIANRLIDYALKTLVAFIFIAAALEAAYSLVAKNPVAVGCLLTWLAYIVYAILTGGEE